MATDTAIVPPREISPAQPAIVAPLKRTMEDDHSPAVSSPLSSEVKTPSKAQPYLTDEFQTVASREKRTKRESLKKRESKGAAGSSVELPANAPDPRQQRPSPLSEVSPMRYKLAPPKPSDFDPPRGPVFVSHHEIACFDGNSIEFFESTEHVYNKKNFHYTHCTADPTFPSSFFYRQTEPEPHEAHINFEDSAMHMFFDKSGGHITTDKGFRMARANVAVREGRWYWECMITQGTIKNRGPGDPESHGHVRVGWARREASLDAPVGFDAYSYGIRDVAGQKVHMSRPKDFFPPGEDLREGDVIGLEIQLPSENLHRKVVQGQYNPAVDVGDEDAPVSSEAPNVVRDRIPIRFKAHIYFEKIDYHTTKELDDLMNPSPMGSSGPVGSAEPPNPVHRYPNLRTLPNSYIKIYKNGVLMGTPFTNLLAFLPPASKPLAQPGAREGLDDGMLGYFPAVSVFRGGAAQVNFGPKFWYPPPGYGATRDDRDVDMKDAGDHIRYGVALGSTNARAMSERYNEQIVEDIVYDIVDEVAFWMQDGAKVIDRTVKDEKAEEPAGTAPGGREEIKELVQDD